MWKVNCIDALELKKEIKPSGNAFLHSKKHLFGRSQYDLFETTCNTQITRS